MLVIVLVLWTLLVLILLNNPRSEYAYWASLALFAGGFGAFGRFLIETLLPYLENHFMVTNNTVYIFQWVYVFATLTNIIFMPCFFFLYCLTFLNIKMNNKIKFSLLLPPIITLLITVLTKPIFPKPSHHYTLLIIWVVPYIIISFYFFIKKYFSEISPMKKQSIASAIFISSPVFFQMFSVYIFRFFGFMEAFRYNALFFSIIIPFVIYFLVKSDLFGIKLKLEKKQLDHSITVLNNSTGIVFHALKNQILLLFASSSNLKASYAESQKNIPEELNILEHTSSHLLEIIERVQEKTQEIVLFKETICLYDLINDTLSAISHLSHSKNISIEINCPSEIRINCDPVHFKEVLHNIFKNSIEASEAEGIIKIYVTENKKHILLSVVDNGHGISQTDINQIFEPFYSTKKFKSNFGLGLTYCYQVMQKHKGSITITSEPNISTTVALKIPNCMS